jgi:hypothetical protein
MKTKEEICDSYQQLMYERPDAEDMYLEMSELLDHLTSSFRELAFEIATTKWTEDKCTKTDGWNLALDCVREEILLRLYYGKELKKKGK